MFCNVATHPRCNIAAEMLHTINKWFRIAQKCRKRSSNGKRSLVFPNKIHSFVAVTGEFFIPLNC